MNRSTEVQASKFSSQRAGLSRGENPIRQNGRSKLILSFGHNKAKQSRDKIFPAGAIPVKDLIQLLTYVCRMATGHTLARRSGFSGLWPAKGFSISPVGRFIHGRWFAGGLVVAGVFEEKAGFANAADCSSRGAPGEIFGVHVVSILSSGPIHIVASLLSSHDDADRFG